MVFLYTPQNNGPFRIPLMPDFKMESGYYTPATGAFDRHTIVVEKDTCIVQEMYNLYAPGVNPSGQCPLCTSGSGVRYKNMSYALPSGATDAAALYLSPLSLHRDEILSGHIDHALRVTLLGAFIKNSHIWPAIAEAGYNHRDALPFGSRLRLKSGFVSSSKNPYTQTLIRQLKEYGLIVADIGDQWAVSTEDIDLYFEPEIYAAFREVAKLVGGKNFEVVDESSLIVNPTSGDTNADAETVIATDKADEKTTSVRVVLTGVTIGTETQYLNVQAGASPHELKAWVNGSENKAVSWSMSPSVGTLTSNGVYTPPSSAPRLQSFTITAKADADPSATTSIAATVLPAGTISIDNGNSSSYTDSKGIVWSPSCCTAYPFTYEYPGPWPNKPDIKLYKDDTVAWNDILYRIYMKPGNYRITAKMAEPSVTSPGVRVMHLGSQDKLIYTYVDLFALAGVRNPIDFDLPAVVGSDGKLDFWVRHVLYEQDLLGALQIAPDPGTPRIQLTPASGGTLVLSEKKRFYAVPWYVSNPSIQWSLSPKLGIIDAKGLYTAPANPVSEDTTVTITASSAADPSLSAAATVQIKKGIPTIRVNCGGGQFKDRQGNVWAGDYGSRGGATWSEHYPIKGAPPDMQPLYQSSRFAREASSFSYSFPEPNGVYQVTLKWAEYRTAAVVALLHLHFNMNVTINGQVVLKNFDPIAAAVGLQTAYDQTFRVAVSNGRMDLVFSGQPGPPDVYAGINGIEIEPEQAELESRALQPACPEIIYNN
jgi:Malectin domain